jgi:site-specific DNA recombinase
MVHSIEKLLQVEVHYPALALGDILLPLGHRLMRRTLRTKAVTVFGERSVPLALQNLHHCLLDRTIQHRRNAQLAHSSVRLGISTRFTACGL